MEIVCPAWCPGAENLTDALKTLADQGVTAVELCTSYPRFGIHYPDYFDHRNAFEIDMMLAQLKSSGIRVNSVHAPFGVNCDISSPCDEVHERGVDALIESIELATVVDAKIIVMHASDALADGISKRLDRARGVLREVSVVAEESGVVLALENLPPGYLGHTPEEIMLLIEGARPGAVGVCFDSGHANLTEGLPSSRRCCFLMPLRCTSTTTMECRTSISFPAKARFRGKHLPRSIIAVLTARALCWSASLRPV